MTTVPDANQLVIDRISDGIVVDHIPPGKALVVLELLGEGGKSFLNKGNIIAVAINVRSLQRPEKRKDVLKIQNFSLAKVDEVRLGLAVPGATLNVIKGLKVVEKRKIVLPKSITGLNCPGSNCITREHEDTNLIFDVVYLEENKPYLRCLYCEESFPLASFLKIK